MIFDRTNARWLTGALIIALGLSLSSAGTAATVTDTATSATSEDVAAGASNPFADVPANHWAYDAVRQLAADGYIQGYPDGQYKGQRPMTRYEAAVLTDRAVRSIEAKLAQLQQVEQRDIADVRRLMAAFRPELDALKRQVATLQQTTADQGKHLNSLQKEADATQLRVNQGKLGFQMDYKPGTAFTNVSVTNGGTTTQLGAGPGQAIRGGQGGTAANLNGTPLSFGPGLLNSAPVGPFSHGFSSTLARFFLAGQVDPRFSYGLRISTRVIQGNALSGATTVTPSFCTNTTTTNCSFTDLASTSGAAGLGGGTQPMNLDYAYIQYSSPGGLTSKIGRWSNGSYGKYNIGGSTQFYGGGQSTGLEVGFNDPNGRLYGEVYMIPGSVTASTFASQAANVCSQNVVGLNTGAVQPQFATVNPNCNTTQSSLAAWGLYYFPYSRTAIGSTYFTDPGKVQTFYDSSAVSCTYAGTARMAMSPALCAANGGVRVAGAAGNYFSAQGAPSGIEGYLTQYFGPFDKPTWNVSFTYDRKLGNDPINGGAWQGGNDYYAQLTYASKGNVFSTGTNNNPFYSARGRKNSNVGQVFFGYYGLNSPTGGGEATYNGTTPLQNATGFSNFNGMQLFGFELGHWFSDEVRVAVGGVHLQNIPGVTIPVGTNGTANTTCAGCFVNSISQNSLLLDTYLYFF